MNRGRARTARDGVTLLETLVALAVFAVGITTFAPLLVSTLRANDAAAVRGRAVGLAQQKAEELRIVPFDDLAAGADIPGPGFTRQWRLLDVPAVVGDGGDLKRVCATVSWGLPGRGAGSVTLVLSRARY